MSSVRGARIHGTTGVVGAAELVAGDNDLDVVLNERVLKDRRLSSFVEVVGVGGCEAEDVAEAAVRMLAKSFDNPTGHA